MPNKAIEDIMSSTKKNPTMAGRAFKLPLSEEDQIAWAKHSFENKPVNAHECLTSAAGHLKDRASAYDSPEGERSMGRTVDAFRSLTHIEMTEEQGWMFMALLKMVRCQQGGFKLDNYEDGAAYFALAAEAASVERV